MSDPANLVPEALGYWAFFPATEPWGRVPAWGHATVVESRHPEVPEGRQFFGFVPMGSHLVLQPGRLLPNGFVDATPALAALPPAYNLYLDPTKDRLHAPGTEDRQCVLRPLFVTSWVLDGLHARSWPGATVVVSGASSKTAIGTAHLLAARRVATVGLTSARSRAFVEGPGVYGRVRTYGEVGDLPDGDAVYYDFAGSAAVRHDVHHALGGRLRHSAIIGSLHQPGEAEPEVLEEGPEPPGLLEGEVVGSGSSRARMGPCANPSPTSSRPVTPTTIRRRRRVASSASTPPASRSPT